MNRRARPVLTSANNEASKRLKSIPGIGLIGATAIAATVPDPKVFGSGRDFAAWIGLVPREDSTGGKQKLGPISKRGDRYFAQAVLHHDAFLDRSDQRLHRLKLRRQHDKARVSIDRQARIRFASNDLQQFLDPVTPLRSHNAELGQMRAAAAQRLNGNIRSSDADMDGAPIGAPPPFRGGILCVVVSQGSGADAPRG